MLVSFLHQSKKMTKPKITIYTDGAARGNPGPGGYGIVLLSGQHRKELSEGYRLTTNNRMELLAVIVALEKGWVFNWVKKRFKGKKNPDLWLRFLEIYKKHDIKFIWVKGHANNPLNERCDQLAVEASFKQNLAEDKGYLSQENNN
jgi:ribonuclease HI